MQQDGADGHDGRDGGGRRRDDGRGRRAGGDQRRGGGARGRRGRREDGSPGASASTRTGDTSATPSRRGEPAGLDRAVRRDDAPPRPARPRSGSRAATVPEPALAGDAPVDVAKGVRRDVQRAASDDDAAERVLQHLTIALASLDARDGATALPHLLWVKGRLPRLATVREALGVALYLEEQYAAAVSELAAHRRLTGSVAHNHLVADAHRALGEGEDRIPSLVEAMEQPDAEVDEPARMEGRIVWASWLADKGDPAAGRAVLTPVLEHAPSPVEEHHLRTWYVAGDLAERAGDREDARRWFGRVVDNAVGFFDADERHAAVSDG